MKPHKHAELIKAWADGAEIQKKSLIGSPTHIPDWEDEKEPRWGNEYFEYRIKPEPKPDHVNYARLVRGYGYNHTLFAVGNMNIKLTFDGETGELKSAEVLK